MGCLWAVRLASLDWGWYCFRGWAGIYPDPNVETRVRNPEEKKRPKITWVFMDEQFIPLLTGVLHIPGGCLGSLPSIVA